MNYNPFAVDIRATMEDDPARVVLLTDDHWGRLETIYDNIPNRAATVDDLNDIDNKITPLELFDAVFSFALKAFEENPDLLKQTIEKETLKPFDEKKTI